MRAGKVLNASGGWSARVAEMVGGHPPARAHPIQLIVTEPAPPLVHHLLAHAERHLTVKQVRNGNLLIGGGWRAALDEDTGHPAVVARLLRGEPLGRVAGAPGARHHARHPLVGGDERGDRRRPATRRAARGPGFFHAVTVNGMTLGPLLGRIMAAWMRTGQAPPGTGFFTPERFG